MLPRIPTSAFRARLEVRVTSPKYHTSQADNFSGGDAGGAGSEDCLKINVYAPASAKKGDKREPTVRAAQPC